MIHRVNHVLPSIASRLDYYDVTWFLLALAVSGLALHASVAARWLPSDSLTNPSDAVQIIVMAMLIVALAMTVTLRAHRSLAADLGWRVASYKWLAAAVAGGVGMAVAVALVAPLRYPVVPKIGFRDGILLAVLLAPLLEESFFRGCLLPVVARPLGPVAAVIITSVLFSLFHHPPTMLHFICFTLAGVTYAWMRIASGSTAAAALMHTAYNLALLSWPGLWLH